MLIIAFEIALILALLSVNGLFAMAEIAVVTAKRIRLQHRAERGDAGAAAALALANDPTEFLSTVQVGITLVGVLAGAFGGATLSERLAVPLTAVPFLGAYAETTAFVLVVALITYLSLIIGELVPKRIALANPERVASRVARPMGKLAHVARPLVQLLTASTRGVLRLFGMRDIPEPGLTEEEIHALVEQGAESGAVPEVEHEIVESVFRLGDREVGAVMTVRQDLEWMDTAITDEELRRTLGMQRRPWYLVCDGDVEKVRGVAHAGDLLALYAADTPFDLRTVLNEPLYVPQTMPVFRLLEDFRNSRQHIAVALDEYGGVAGVVTLDDIVGELVGDIPQHGAEDEPRPMIRADAGWIATGNAAIEDVLEELELAPATLSGERGYRTLGGFIVARVGRVPRRGDAFEWQEHRFEVIAMDGRRVERVRITSTA